MSTFLGVFAFYESNSVIGFIIRVIIPFSFFGKLPECTMTHFKVVPHRSLEMEYTVLGVVTELCIV
ncbi:hypothetical protein PBCV1_a393L [Paramecium bursaria Chlorella virus 1]|uniref:Uncharacterized protein n=1 Tax=Paramecium bursaria Chlorella virus 1 TaxID=10506 RepID=Q98445_PBCV1|nr:hypothetical protein PBCV1_a393L [Paramecium bursaria Chlorella virus 1]AAC96761.2 hypothetical protein [Paramecium bursaria Chlorella virus 1]